MINIPMHTGDQDEETGPAGFLPDSGDEQEQIFSYEKRQHGANPGLSIDQTPQK